MARAARARCLDASGRLRHPAVERVTASIGKTPRPPDHFFTGFPSYWNIVVFYLFVAGFPLAVNAAILLVLAGLVFVPIRYVYPSRTPVLQPLTIALGAVWAVLMLVMLWEFPAVSRAAFWASLGFPAYYMVLSLTLNFRRRRARGLKPPRYDP